MLPGALVDLGGDVAVLGSPPDARPLADRDRRPATGRALSLGVILDLEEGGVATSGRNARRFGPGRDLHHLIDPATGAPAVAGPLAVTVVAPDAAWAEIHATALAISDLAEARAHVAARSDVSAPCSSLREGAPVPLGSLPLEPEAEPIGVAA